MTKLRPPFSGGTQLQPHVNFTDEIYENCPLIAIVFLEQRNRIPPGITVTSLDEMLSSVAQKLQGVKKILLKFAH